MRRLEPDLIEVIPFLLDEEDTISLEQARSWLSEEELERAGAFRFEVHQNRFMRGRAMVRRELGEHLDVDPAALVFELGERGKPFLVNEPVHFNLSHSEDRAVLAISNLSSIGIDIERFDRSVDIDGLSRRCFRPSECERIDQLRAEEKQRAFFWTWTAKEARMKATGEGFGLEPKKIEIHFEGEWPWHCVAPVDPKAYVAPVQVHGGEVACTVAATSPFRIEVRNGK